MKRDMELIRKLLFYFDEKPGPQGVEVPQIEGYDDTSIKYHCLLLYQAGLLTAEPVLSEKGRVIKVFPFDLTWDGHEFLDLARNATVWNRAKAKLTGALGTATYGLLRILLSRYAEDAIEGIEGIVP